jgi:endogenous inhibitor of DNA gyrase (YacG/DUF329 family)
MKTYRCPNCGLAEPVRQCRMLSVGLELYCWKKQGGCGTTFYVKGARAIMACKQCGIEFLRQRRHRKYCSNRCKVAAYRARKK